MLVITGDAVAGCSTDMLPPGRPIRKNSGRPFTPPVHPVDNLGDMRRAQQHAGFNDMPWWAGWRCMTAAILRLSSGSPPHGAHAAFLTRNIDAVTLLGRSTPSEPLSDGSSNLLLGGGLTPSSVVAAITPLEMARALESICRGLSNLAEEFHHARPSYIMLTPSQLVEDVWYVVPQLILLGNLLFPILVYGYFVSSVHAQGAASMLFQLVATAVLFAVVADGWLVPHVLATAEGGAHAGEAAQAVAAAWLGVWALQLALLSRYSTSPEELEECTSERLRLAVEKSGAAAADMPLATVEQEAAALLVLPEAEASGSAVPASFMVARTAVYLWLFVGLEVAFVSPLSSSDLIFW